MYRPFDRVEVFLEHLSNTSTTPQFFFWNELNWFALICSTNCSNKTLKKLRSNYANSFPVMIKLWRSWGVVEVFLRCWSNTSRAEIPVFIVILEDFTEVFEKTNGLENSDNGVEISCRALGNYLSALHNSACDLQSQITAFSRKIAYASPWTRKCRILSKSIKRIPFHFEEKTLFLPFFL